jgi:hypothetical protein
MDGGTSTIAKRMSDWSCLYLIMLILSFFFQCFSDLLIRVNVKLSVCPLVCLFVK